MFVTSFGGNRAITDAIEDDFKANEVINYQIVEGKLQSVNNATQGFTAEELSSTIGVNVNFIFAKNVKIGGEELYLKLKENGILVRHFSNQKICDYVRITIGTPDQMERVLQTLEEIIGGKK